MDIRTIVEPAVQVAIVMGLAEIAKKVGIPTKWIPVFDVVLGMISGVFVYGLYLGQGITEGLLLGIGIGLSACGLFSGVKNTLEDRTDDQGH